jgi:hypothetical protein
MHSAIARFLLSLVAPCFLIGAESLGAQTISTSSLLNEMLDRDAVARFPQPAYVTSQASSYDRQSVSPDKPGWFANNDWSQFLRSEAHGMRVEWVMMDADGPGCITRFWVTGPKVAANLRIYVDGAEAPLIEANASEIVGGTELVGPPLSQVSARGQNLYLPIPYAKHCKITYDAPLSWQSQNRNDRIYYNIEYRTYPPGTAVETFSLEKLASIGVLIDRVQKELVVPKSSTPAFTDVIALEPSGQTVQNFSGPAAIRLLRAHLDASDLSTALRQVVISIHFDGEQTVWCPLGEFFGSGVGLNPFQTFTRAADKNGDMILQWPMPFERSCEIRLENAGDQPAKLKIAALTAPWKWDDRSMHFHCAWRQQRDIRTRPRQGMIDWNYVTIRGKGVYVGDNLAAFNPVAPWWGEGDEKVWVDGEHFPSHFGTGTEDFYGYAYGSGELFSHPFHAQTRHDGPKSEGFTCLTRERTLDCIPFQSSLKFDLEIWHWVQTKLTFAATSYWYARPGATFEPTPQPEEVRRPLGALMRP